MQNNKTNIAKIYIATDGGCSKNGTKDCVASYGYCIICDSDIVSVNNIKNESKNLTGAKLQELLDGEIDCYEGSGLVKSGDDLPTPTNNRGELTGLVAALKKLEEEDLSGDIVWISDSEYSQKSIDIWCRNWLKDPKKYKLETKLNLDLIIPLKDAIDELRKTRKVSLVHIKSHKKAPIDVDSIEWLFWFLNYRVDLLCVREIDKAKNKIENRV